MIRTLICHKYIAIICCTLHTDNRKKGQQEENRARYQYRWETHFFSVDPRRTCLYGPSIQTSLWQSQHRRQMIWWVF